jgi:arginase
MLAYRPGRARLDSGATPMPQIGDDVLDQAQTASMTATTARTRDVRLLGVRLELGAASRGTLMGPDALRTAGIARALGELGHRVADGGNLVSPEPVEVAMPAASAGRCRHLAGVAGWIRALHDAAYAMAAEGVPVFLGGDHSISMGSVSGVARRAAEEGRELGVLWLDAHADYNTPETSPSGNLHGMALAMLAGEPALAPILDRPFVPIRRENPTSSARARSTRRRRRGSRRTGSTPSTCGRSTSAGSRR